MNYCVIVFTISAYFTMLSPHFSVAHNGTLQGTFEGRRSRRAISSYSFSRDHIPGTNLKTGTFYVLRMKRFPSGYVSWSTRKHATGYNYVFVDNVQAHRVKYGAGGEWHKDVQWAFLTSSEPGWYHVINRAIPCQYATWSDSETIDSDGTFYMIIDPNHPGSHSEEDFLFKPIQHYAEAVDSPYYQLKLKSLQNGVIAWNAGNSSNEAYYIHVESTDDENWLRRYDWGHIWYDDTLFSFEEVNDQTDQKMPDDETGNEIQNQHQYASLVGEFGYNKSNVVKNLPFGMGLAMSLTIVQCLFNKFYY